MRQVALRSVLLTLVATATMSPSVRGQITVSPTGVNLAAQGPTTVFLTFGGLTNDLVPAEAFWCGAVIDASPDIGQRCDPTTLYGRLPIRFDLSRLSGTGGFTDIMSVPASVARRAYQDAAAGLNAGFFYVRRFASLRGGRDVFVPVICRLTGGGAGVPFSLTDVRLSFDADVPVVSVPGGVDPPSLHADITYTGGGRLRGRWEVVLPGEDPPTELDLLPEASLPLEERGSQRHFTELQRFDVFVRPGGRLRLPGPDPRRLPRDVDGAYLVLLRIEASDDRDSQSDLSAVGSGTAPVSSGAVAGFPLPTLLYVVGSGEPTDAPAGSDGRVALLQPADGGSLDIVSGDFTWVVVPLADHYRLEIERDDGTPVFDALVSGAVAAYRPPPLLAELAVGAPLRWRVRALDVHGREVARSDWHGFALSSGTGL